MYVTVFESTAIVKCVRLVAQTHETRDVADSSEAKDIMYVRFAVNVKNW